MAILTKGQTFANADTVTSTKLNALVDSATFVTGASGTTDDTSLEVNGSGRLQIKDLGVTSAKIAASGVTTAKIASATGASDGVTYAKLQHVANMRVIGNVSGALAAPTEVSILDEDTMSSDSATAIPTQQSVKAYVDAEVGGLYVAETVAATTAGQTVTFGSLPSWVKRITVMLDSVSTDGTEELQVRIGDSGGIETTGYVSTASNYTGVSTSTTGFFITNGIAAANQSSGTIVVSKLSGNIWVASGNVNHGSFVSSSSGIKTLTGTLTQIQLRTSGSDNFDNGQVNITYE